MFRKITAMSSLWIYGCSLMPGMQNLDTSRFERLPMQSVITPHPVLIKITPSFLASQPVKKYSYKIAPSDILNISVWGHNEFGNLETSNNSSASPATQGAAGQAGYLVNSKGNIYFPLVGYLKVAGLSADAVRDKLSKKLRKYITNPQLNIRIADYRGRKIYVVGEVKRPGLLPINDQILTITDALVLTGGIDQNVADPKHIYVIRGSLAKPQIYWLNAKTPDKLLLAERFILYPKDILYISSAPASRWNRMINQILPSFESIWYTKAVTS